MENHSKILTQERIITTHNEREQDKLASTVIIVEEKGSLSKSRFNIVNYCNNIYIPKT